MTRPFMNNVHCPHCNKWHTAETAFERWMRNHRSLQSTQAGIVRFDCDVLLHSYLTPTDKRSTRELQCLMFIEVKTHGADVDETQRDTLSMLSQVLRNRKRNIKRDKKGMHAEDHVPLAAVFSWKNKRKVKLRMFGGHLLQLSDNDPQDSGWMKWDYHEINTDQLLQLLRFEVDPDDINRKMDWRRRYGATMGDTPFFSLMGV